ncbi:MAG: O-antigen ligase family protein [Candidatus Izemoplasmataceae bacterium]
MSRLITLKYKQLSQLLERFFYSDFYITRLSVIAIAAFFLRLEIYAIFFLAFIIAINLIFVKDVLPTFLPLLLIGMVPLARYGEVSYFYPVLLYALIFMIPAMLLRAFIYPVKFKIGRFFYPTLAVSSSIVLGGLFAISLEDYFALRSIYYVIGLGPFMVLVYFALETYLPKDNHYMAMYFAKIMTAIGVMGIAMYWGSIALNQHLVDEQFPRSLFQWRNNVSNNLLLSMPFAFYLGLKHRYPGIYFTIGILQFVTLIFLFSRGGMISAAIVFPFIMAATFFISNGRKYILVIDFIIVMALIYFVFEWKIAPWSEIIQTMISRLRVSDTESRAMMYRYAVELFFKYPLFGTGLGYDVVYYNPQPMAMFWYHSTFFQIVGSLGLFGIAAYGYQMVVRGYTLLEEISRFSVFAALSIFGFALYSMVNVGYFIPLPFGPVVLGMFIILERYSHMIKTNRHLRKKERLFKYYRIRPFIFIKDSESDK